MNARVPRTRQIIAAVIRNALEWYDFAVFGFARPGGEQIAQRRGCGSPDAPFTCESDVTVRS